MELVVRPGRKVVGAAAVVLPFNDAHKIDWASFEKLVARTVAAGLIPAVNMDTGYVQLLDEAEQQQVLDITAGLTSTFYAGVHVADEQGSSFALSQYQRVFDVVAGAGATPVIFPSWGLNRLDGQAWVQALVDISRESPFIGFELGRKFVPYGRIFDLDTYVALMQVPHCIGAKHSSLSRELEWDRLRCRDEHRRDFRVFTGNDLGIDMITYGSDYLLGLAAAAPDAFGHRDRLWEQQDPAFYAYNDLLQYLGAFAFRAPVPAYKHSIARFLHLRGWIDSPHTHPMAPTRDASETEVLRLIATDLEQLMDTRAASSTGD